MPGGCYAILLSVFSEAGWPQISLEAHSNSKVVFLFMTKIYARSFDERVSNRDYYYRREDPKDIETFAFEGKVIVHSDLVHSILMRYF